MASAQRLLLLGSLATAALGAGPRDCAAPGGCPASSERSTPADSLLQTRQRREKSTASDLDLEERQGAPSNRSAAANAQFLMKATFGPTRATLKELGETTIAQWIDQQMQKPASSHREYYRRRSNMQFEEHMAPFNGRGGGFVPWPPCSRGSRWHDYALAARDERRTVTIEGGRVYVGNELRTFIDKDRFTSHYKWSHLGNFTGEVCDNVKESIGGTVHLHTASCNTACCKNVENPDIWLDGAGAASQTNLSFEALLPGAVLLGEDAARDCGLASHNFTLIGGKYYRYDARVQLVDNTPEAPRTTEVEACPTLADFAPETCRVNPANATCPLVCGSQNEVANDPRLGYSFAMKHRHHDDHPTPIDYDNDFKYGPGDGKRLVWHLMAMNADDQLRQRVAWALMQILVVGAPDRKDWTSEGWLHYYDILVHNAFGNFRDILGNITFSRIMEHYLTYHRNAAFDFVQSYADENYARELMQLFTIGVEALHPNGTAVLDGRNETVQTYTNENVMNFARVLTGFGDPPVRTNVQARNADDPVVMKAHKHDRYPKPDLRGNFLGDGYPLCEDLPKHHYLAVGATYDFLGFKRLSSFGDDIYAPAASSPLYAALCRERDGECHFEPRLRLEEAQPCSGVECDTETLRVVEVRLGGVAGYYEYVAPTCVYHFFYNGREVTASYKAGVKAGHCADPAASVAGAACCLRNACSNTPSNSMKKQGKICSSTGGSLNCQSDRWQKKKFCRLACYESGNGYAGDNCSAGPERAERVCGHLSETGLRRASAEAACRARGLDICPWAIGVGTCRSNQLVWTAQTCSAGTLVVHDDGKVSAHTKYHEPTRFSVKWNGNAPIAREYNVTVEVEPIFRSAPSQEELLAELPAMAGAFPLEAGCARSCGPDGLVCHCGALDADAVLEFQGRFYKNGRSFVSVGGGRRFRNPPVFRVKDLLYVRVTDWSEHGDRLSIAEVHSLLDHLHAHENTAPFIAKLLIQRLVKSNPSPQYVHDVVGAWKAGAYAGKTYSGREGDLAATVAAILMHPEAHDQSRPTDGALREPLLKLVHFMRAMEYAPDGAVVAFQDLVYTIGQDAYRSPSVFNFYDPDFTPDRFAEGVYAPEFQIFDAPFSVGFANGMLSLIKHGLMDQKERKGKLVRPGFGYQAAGPQGHLAYQAVNGSTMAETIDELDLLLTGKRLSSGSKEAIINAYEQAADGERLQAAQSAIVMSPEFHTYGDTLSEGAGVRPALVSTSGGSSSSSSSTSLREYRAVVMVFLRGGADTFNVLVPIECPLYEEYKAVRQNIAYQSSDDFHKINATGQPCAQFGVHKALPHIAGLYRAGHAAFVSNLGALQGPVTRETLASGDGLSCNGWYSHKHMQASAQTLVCQTPGAAPRGVGGRIADAVSSGQMQYKAQSFSVIGNNIFLKGDQSTYQVVDKRLGTVRFHDLSKWEDVLDNITRHKHGNVFCEEFAQAFSDQVREATELGNHLDAVELMTTYATDYDFAQRLHQVARLIATREARQSERDFFFVGLNRWDMHHNLMEELPQELEKLDLGIHGFVQELNASGVFGNVTIVTHSDFGRTLTSNGDGADHAWAGNHMVIGGSVHGGQVLNDFPETLLEHTHNHSNAYDAGRGRLIPKYPWESVMAPIARWMGVADSQLAAVFPNYRNFNESEHIIGAARGDSLFH